MRIVIAGGTGFLGSPLAEVYAEEGHDVRVLTRGLEPGESRHDPGTGVPGVTRVGWKPDGQSGPWASALDGADALVNLAGEGIGDHRWTPQRKAQLRDSRVIPTRSLVAALKTVSAPPPVFVSGSAVGYYGDTNGETKTEDAPAGKGFLAELTEDWEAEARKAEGGRTRVVLLRSGIVLEKSGGALAKMIPPFRMFAGGPLGSGRQYMSWIHRIDWVELVRWIVETPDAAGPFNGTAPDPVTNRQLARALGHALHRPSLIPAPGFALRMMFGEFADDGLLASQRAVPAKARSMGFHFRYPTIQQAFRGIFGE
jgi:hypothetical protein